MGFNMIGSMHIHRQRSAAAPLLVHISITVIQGWKGSIYKLIWKDLIVFLALFYAINLTYRFALDGESKLLFEKVIRYCNKYYNMIPLSFVLGFYVTIVMNRWWEQFTAIPYPDNLALLLSASIQAQDEKGKLFRRTIVRYLCLAFAITMSLISPKAKKRFPSYDHFVEAGLMMKDEKKIFEDMDFEYPGYTKYWLPLAWAGNLVTKARRDGLVTSDTAVRSILQEMNSFRSKCGSLLDYDWISVPLVYTQVVTLAVYSYFCTTILAQQMIDPDTDLYFPFLTVLEFFFYMGWLKVAETLINPFGEDDDDFEVNWLIDRHVLITYLLVDKMHQEHPKLIKDQYWQKMAPQQIPYTVASEQYMGEQPVPSTDSIVVKKAQSEILIESRRVIIDAGMQNLQKVWDPLLRDTRDGRVKRQGSFFKKWRKDSKMSHRPVNTSDEIIQMDTGPSSPVDKVSSVTLPDIGEFEKLKKYRQSQTKKKLKRWLSLLRRSNMQEKEENEIINDIIST